VRRLTRPWRRAIKQHVHRFQHPHPHHPSFEVALGRQLVGALASVLEGGLRVASTPRGHRERGPERNDPPKPGAVRAG